jgi:hypothetical protein
LDSASARGGAGTIRLLPSETGLIFCPNKGGTTMPKSQQIEVASVETLTLWKIDNRYYSQINRHITDKDDSRKSLSGPHTPQEALQLFAIIQRLQGYIECCGGFSPEAVAELIEEATRK